MSVLASTWQVVQQSRTVSCHSRSWAETLVQTDGNPNIRNLKAPRNRTSARIKLTFAGRGLPVAGGCYTMSYMYTPPPRWSPQGSCSAPCRARLPSTHSTHRLPPLPPRILVAVHRVHRVHLGLRSQRRHLLLAQARCAREGDRGRVAEIRRIPNSRHTTTPAAAPRPRNAAHAGAF